MMWYWNNGMGWGWGGWLVSGTVMILFSGLVIWGIVVLLRSLNAPGQQTSFQTRGHESTGTPEQILAERFARGDIEEEEYKRRLAVLESPTRATASGGSTASDRDERTIAQPTRSA